MTVRKERPCPVCDRATEQETRIDEDGPHWWCLPASHVARRYTAQEATEALQRLAQLFPQRPKYCVTIPDGYKVFLEGDPEIEVAHECIVEHCATVGALPVVGKPLQRRLAGLPPPLDAVAWGKVSRTE